MLDTSFVIAVLGGALLAVPYVLHAGRSGKANLGFGLGLAVAALVYVVLAAVAGDAAAARLEGGGVLLFAAVGALGMRGSAWWLALGWLGHVVWDLALHPVEHASYAPWWYPVACVGFDLLVVGYLVALAGKGLAGRTGSA